MGLSRIRGELVKGIDTRMDDFVVMLRIDQVDCGGREYGIDETRVRCITYVMIHE